MLTKNNYKDAAITALTELELLQYIAFVLTDIRDKDKIDAQLEIRNRIHQQQLERDLEAYKKHMRSKVETTYGTAETMPKI